jgi:hypothetical protein
MMRAFRCANGGTGRGGRSGSALAAAQPRTTVTAVTGRRWRRLLTELECKGTVAGPGPWGRRQLERELQGADTSFSSNFGTHRESQSSEITVTRRQTRPISTPRRTNIDIAKLPKHTKSYTLLLTSTATQCHSEHYWKHLILWAGTETIATGIPHSLAHQCSGWQVS